MQKGYRANWSRLGRVEKTLLILVLVYVILRVSGLSAGLQLLTAVAAVIFGFWTLFRIGGIAMRKAIWRLRNRLIVAYLVIAVVPIVLILTLALITGWALIGSVAVYFVRTELANREAMLLNEAQRMAGRARPGSGPQGGRPGSPTGGEAGRGLPRVFMEGGRGMPPRPDFFMGRGGRNGTSFDTARGEQAGRGGTNGAPRAPLTAQNFRSQMATAVSERYPDSEVLIVSNGTEQRFPQDAKITAPPPEWGRASGIIVKQSGDARRLYMWAHATGYDFENKSTEVTILVPLTSEILSDLVPAMGDVTIMSFLADPQKTRVPKAANAFDFTVRNGFFLELSSWDSPSRPVGAMMAVRSRVSAILGKMYEQKAGQVSQGEALKYAFYAIVALFLFVEIAALWAGIRITRTMTGAVHELYEGTRRVKEGDFSHRIPVKGTDQLAELSSSFNTMTENLGQLIVVAKEKERLQSELEIAREVQNQLFPRDIPSSQTLQLTGVCKPARVVSGDYYDFLTLPGSELAFAIGDVAGKGISAALLMATIQSTMRTQLNAVNGSGLKHLSAAGLVAQLNKQLYANTTPEKYATFYFALYDEERHNLTYTNAGHLSPLLMRDGDFTDLSPTGTVVGAFPFARYEERTVELKQGDIVVAYTDGIVEPENPYGEMFGDNRLKEILVRNAYADSSEIIAKVMEAVGQWTGSGELQDDMTMVVARRI